MTKISQADLKRIAKMIVAYAVIIGVPLALSALIIEIIVRGIVI